MNCTAHPCTASADLLRIAEPGDSVLAALRTACGCANALRLAVDGSAGARARIAAALADLGAECPEADLRRSQERWRMRIGELDAARDIRIMAGLGARIVCRDDPEWPAGLADLGSAEPLALWVRGPVPLADALTGAIAVVGSRASDDYGEALTRRLTAGITAAGRTVVSGGAYGIDTAAHRAALARGGTTIAFAAGGVDALYPRGNTDLLEQITRTGAVVSEAPPGATAMRHRFLLRNRLIAAASAATVVVQAGHRSGALHTANRAAEALRPVAAFPGPVLSPSSAGCHRLIREGAAVLVTGPEDVLELVDPLDIQATAAAPEQGELRLIDGLGPDALRMFGALPVRGGADPAALARRAGLSLPEALAALGALELAGKAQRTRRGWSKT